MNKLLLFIISLISLLNFAKAQTVGTQEKNSSTVVEQQAEYPGGLTAMVSYLKRSVVIPDSARKAGIVGRCLVKFIVRRDGSIDSVVVIKSVSGCPVCDSTAVRAVRSMPRWQPARLNGNPVNCYFNLPINFK